LLDWIGVEDRTAGPSAPSAAADFAQDDSQLVRMS